MGSRYDSQCGGIPAPGGILDPGRVPDPGSRGWGPGLTDWAGRVPNWGWEAVPGRGSSLGILENDKIYSKLRKCKLMTYIRTLRVDSNRILG